MDLDDIDAVIREALRGRGLSVHRAELMSGLPQDAIRNVLGGHKPKSDRLAEIAAALGLEFYIGPPRESGVAWGPLALSAGVPDLAEERLRWIAEEFERWDNLQRDAFPERFRAAMAWALDASASPARPPAAESVPEPAPDRRLAEALAAVVGAFEELNERGREDLLVRFWFAFPDLKERSDAGN